MRDNISVKFSILSIIVFSLFLISLPAYLAIGIPPFFYRLELHQDIDLGTIDSSLYNIRTNEWQPLVDDSGNKINVVIPDFYTNRDLKVEVAANDTGGTPIDDLSDLQIKGGEISSWTALTGKLTLCEISEEYLYRQYGIWKLYSIDDISYRYLTDFKDGPGSFKVEVVYTISE